MSKRTKTTHPRREKKEPEKHARKPAKPRRAPTKAAPPPSIVPEKRVEKEPEPAERYLVAVRLDGKPTVRHPEESTLGALGMKSRFSAVLIRDNPSMRGMLQKVKDHITWGEAKKADVELLLSNRAKTADGLGITDKFVKEKAKLAGLSELLSALYSGKLKLAQLWELGIRPVFRLHPPRGGFAKSSKRPYANRGELGYRRDGLRELLTKMC